MAQTIARALRVASVPSGHPYVRHLSVDVADSGATRVLRLPDPLPAGAAAGQWWPPVVLDAGWIAAHSDEIDVLHVHFGTESHPTAHLAAVVEQLRADGIPLVHTVHDLVNPQLTDQAEHLAHLDLLVTAADELITLTPGAASEIRDRWGRMPTVIPHPNLLPLDAPFPDAQTSGVLVIGTHLRDLRPNIDAVGTVTAMVRAVDTLRARGIDAVARVDLNERVRDASVRDEVRRVAAASPHVDLREHPRMSDAELAASLAGLDVAVLPYRHGTHSGWVELCFDLGVPVAGPRVGYASEQHPDAEFFAAFDEDTLADAVLALTSRDDAPRVGSAARRALQAARRSARVLERVAIEDAHVAVYAAALARVHAAGVAR